jgi:TrbL/VirB6 plasmid conjugal transfer protein
MRLITASRRRPRARWAFLVALALTATLASTAANAATQHPHSGVILTAAVRPAPGTPGLLGPLTGADQDGVPLSHYDISGNDENGWDVPATIMLFLTNAFFTFARFLVGAEVWMLNWAFSFGAAKALLGPAATIAAVYQQQVIGCLGLAGTLLTFAAFWCGIMILRGRTSRGAGELAVSVLISALAGTLLASPASLLLGNGGLLGQTRDTAMSLASITATGGATDTESPGQAAAPLTSTLVSTFVVEPYQLLNFGTLIDAPDVPASCQAAYTQIVQGGPWGDAGTPRNMMAAAGCQDLANYDANLTWDRLMGTILLLIAVMFVTVLVVLITGTLLIAQFSFAAYTIACPVVITLAVLPGTARGFLWRWAGGIAKVIVVIFAIVMFIPLFAIFIRALLDGSASQPLAVRFFLLDLAAVAGLVFHRKLVNAGIRAGHQFGRRLEGARIGGTHGSGLARDTAGAGLAALSVAETHRGARAEVNRVATPVRQAARQAQRVWTGKRTPAPSDASGLQSRMATTLGGRTVLRTAKVARTAATVAFGSTIGAPVMIPRAAKAARTAAHARSAVMKAKLATATAKHGGAARQFGREWAAGTGLTAATGALKKGPLPAAVLSTAIRTAPAASPKSKASYSAAAPRTPGAEPPKTPATPARAHTPSTLPKVKPLQLPPDASKPPPKPRKPASPEEIRKRLDAQAACKLPGVPPPTVVTVTTATRAKKGPGAGTAGRSG